MVGKIYRQLLLACSLLVVLNVGLWAQQITSLTPSSEPVDNPAFTWIGAGSGFKTFPNDFLDGVGSGTILFAPEGCSPMPCGIPAAPISFTVAGDNATFAIDILAGALKLVPLPPGHGQVYIDWCNDGCLSNTIPFTITASAVPTLSVASGDMQVGETGQQIMSPLVVQTLDQNGQPVAEVPVSFAITQSPQGSTGDSLTPDSAITGTDGTASAAFTPGALGGYQITANCSTCTPVSSVTFTVPVCVKGYSTRKVLLFDPVPTLLSASGPPSITGLESDLSDSSKGRPVDGVAADGVAQILVRIPACQSGEQEKITILNDSGNPSGSSDEDGALGTPGPIFGGSVTLAVAATTDDKNPMSFVAYMAPPNFVRPADSVNPNARSDPDSLQRSITLQIHIPSLPGKPITKQIIIVRPRLVLIHGIWSSRNAWNNFLPGLAKFRPYPLDYSQTSARGVHENAILLLPQLADSIQSFGTAFNVAAVQADLVAHSIGGLITREFTQLAGFAVAETYGRGYVHKLITIDTPYQGSPFANRLLASPLNCHALFFEFGNSADGGAIRDLAVGSSLMRSLMDTNGSQRSLQAHSVIGIASTLQESLTEKKWLVQGLAGSCGLLPQNSFEQLFEGASDLIVSQDSQDAVGVAIGLSSPLASKTFSSVIHEQDQFVFTFGPGVLASADVLDHVRLVLDSPNTGADFVRIKPTF